MSLRLGLPALALGLTILVTPAAAQDKWIVEFSNIDDYMLLNVDSNLVGLCAFRQRCTYDISAKIAPSGSNIKIFVYNAGGPYAYGYKIMRNGEPFAVDFCGFSNNVGCDAVSNIVGVQQTFDFSTNAASSLGAEPSAPPRAGTQPKNAPARDSWTVVLSNIDDYMMLSVDGKSVGRCDLLKTCTFDITANLSARGSNINIQAYNTGGPYTFGYKILRNGEPFAVDFCGVPCDNNSTALGLIRDIDIPISSKVLAIGR